MAQSAKIAVLGGGIAGCTCCLRLAALGHRPVWIARPEPPGDKPGELLSAAARPMLAELGLADLLERPYHRPANSMFSVWGHGLPVERSGIVHLEGPQTVLDRPAFERDLRERVLEAGAALVEADILGVERSDQGWLVRHHSGAIPCSFVVDATGRRARAGRTLSRRFRADQLVVLYAFLKQDRASTVDPTPATLIEATPDGWWYATYLTDGRLAVNYYTDADLLPRRGTEDGNRLEPLLTQSSFVRRWIEEASFETAAATSSASTATTWLAPCAGEGWLAVGDAAAAFDPLSSHGMTTALWTGLAGAEAAIAAAAGDRQPLEGFVRKVSLGVSEFLQQRKAIYGQERRFPDRPFWQRRHGSPA